MPNCLNCDKGIEQTQGKREREFCNSTCRSNYWQKQKRLSEKPNPLTLHELVYANGAKKGRLAEKSLIDLAKNATKDTPTDSEYKNYTAKVSNVVIMDIEKTQRIAKIEELLKASPKYLPKSKRTLLENELMELKKQIQ